MYRAIYSVSAEHKWRYTMSLTKKFNRAVAAGLIAAVALTGLTGCESRMDVQQKPAVATALIQNSAGQYQSAPRHPDTYNQRLYTVLMNTYTEDMLTLQSYNIKVCLDQRLSSQDLGFFDKRADAVLYMNGSQDNLLCLWDDGRTAEETGFFNLQTTYSQGSECIKKLAQALRNGEISSPGTYYGARYTHPSGKSSYTISEWKPSADFSQGTLQKNPALRTPPAKVTQTIQRNAPSPG